MSLIWKLLQGRWRRSGQHRVAQQLKRTTAGHACAGETHRRLHSRRTGFSEEWRKAGPACTLFFGGHVCIYVDLYGGTRMYRCFLKNTSQTHNLCRLLWIGKGIQYPTIAPHLQRSFRGSGGTTACPYHVMITDHLPFLCFFKKHLPSRIGKRCCKRAQ